MFPKKVKDFKKKVVKANPRKVTIMAFQSKTTKNCSKITTSRSFVQKSHLKILANWMKRIRKLLFLHFKNK